MKKKNHSGTAKPGSDGSRRRGARSLTGRSIKVIGLGGVGAPVAQALAQFLAFRKVDATLWLVDGDSYEEANRERVLFFGDGQQNKAIVKAWELDEACRSAVNIVPVPKYVTPRNVRRIVDEGDIVFLCVDNHASRRPVSNRCRKLDNVLLVSGGNDGIEQGRRGTFGSVQIYRRENGQDRTHPITRFHQEIAKPADKRPDELGCAAVAPSAPQLLFTNLAVASAMLGAFYAWLTEDPQYEEIYLDIVDATMTAVQRKRTA